MGLFSFSHTWSNIDNIKSDHEQILQALRLTELRETFLTLPEHLFSPLQFGEVWYTFALGPVQIYTSPPLAASELMHEGIMSNAMEAIAGKI